MELEQSDDSRQPTNKSFSNQSVHHSNSNLSTMTQYNFPLSNSSQQSMHTIENTTASYFSTPQHHAQQPPSMFTESNFSKQPQQASMFQGFGGTQTSHQGSIFSGFSNWTPQMPNTMENFANRQNVFDKNKNIPETPKRITRASRAKIKPENIVYNGYEGESEDEDFNQATEEDEHRSSDGVQADEEDNNEDSNEGDSFDGLVDDEEEGGPIDLNDYMQKRAFL